MRFADGNPEGGESREDGYGDGELAADRARDAHAAARGARGGTYYSAESGAAAQFGAGALTDAILRSVGAGADANGSAFKAFKNIIS